MKKPKAIDRPDATPAPRGGFRQDQRADIPEEALTPREQKVLRTLRQSAGALTIMELARKCFPGLRAKGGTYEVAKADGTRERQAMGAAYRAVLNSLRRLVVGGHAEKAERGTYRAIDRSTQAEDVTHE